MDVLSRSTQETEELAKRLAAGLKVGDILALHGDLGSGKTTFTSYLVSALGIEKRVQSPTFVILRRYAAETDETAENIGGSLNGIKIVNHLDLYRVQSKAEVEDLGLGELFSEPNSIGVIEWPEIAQEFLPENVIKINFEYVDENTRRIYAQNLN